MELPVPGGLGGGTSFRQGLSQYQQEPFLVSEPRSKVVAVVMRGGRCVVEAVSQWRMAGSHGPLPNPPAQELGTTLDGSGHFSAGSLPGRSPS